MFIISNNGGLWPHDGSAQKRCGAPEVCLHGRGEWVHLDAQVSWDKG